MSAFQYIGFLSLLGYTITLLTQAIPAAGALGATPPREELRAFFSGEITDAEMERLRTVSNFVVSSGPEILPVLIDLYTTSLSERGSLVEMGCGRQILRLARGDHARATIESLLSVENLKAHMLALKIASENGLPSSEYRAAAANVFRRYKEIATQTGMAPVDIFLKLDRYCGNQEAVVIAELLEGKDGGVLSLRQRGAALLVKIGDERSLAALRKLYARWLGEEPDRIQNEIRERKTVAEEGGNVWDPKSPAATKGLREDWLNSIGASITNLENRLRKEGRLPPSAK